MNNKVIFSVIESIYIIFMFNYFKTKIALDHGFILNLFKIENGFFKHQVNNGIYRFEKPENMICPFGHLISWFIGLFLILRNYIPFLKKINKIIITIILIGSLMNINAFFYLLPFFLYEYLYN